jgi:hypothetical protein
MPAPAQQLDRLHIQLIVRVPEVPNCRSWQIPHRGRAARPAESTRAVPLARRGVSGSPTHRQPNHPSGVPRLPDHPSTPFIPRLQPASLGGCAGDRLERQSRSFSTAVTRRARSIERVRTVWNAVAVSPIVQHDFSPAFAALTPPGHRMDRVGPYRPAPLGETGDRQPFSDE